MAAQGGCVGSEPSAHPALQPRRLNRPTHNLLPPYENPPVYHGTSELLLPAHLPGFVWDNYTNNIASKAPCRRKELRVQDD